MQTPKRAEPGRDLTTSALTYQVSMTVEKPATRPAKSTARPESLLPGEIAGPPILMIPATTRTLSTMQAK